jgi:hypothetical protein
LEDDAVDLEAVAMALEDDRVTLGVVATLGDDATVLEVKALTLEDDGVVLDAGVGLVVDVVDLEGTQVFKALKVSPAVKSFPGPVAGGGLGAVLGFLDAGAFAGGDDLCPGLDFPLASPEDELEGFADRIGKLYGDLPGELAVLAGLE